MSGGHEKGCAASRTFTCRDGSTVDGGGFGESCTCQPPTDDGERAFGEWWARWHAGRVNLRLSTRERDGSYWRTLIAPTLAALPIGRIQPDTLRAWIASLVAGYADIHGDKPSILFLEKHGLFVTENTPNAPHGPGIPSPCSPTASDPLIVASGSNSGTVWT